MKIREAAHRDAFRINEICQESSGRFKYTVSDLCALMDAERNAIILVAEKEDEDKGIVGFVIAYNMVRWGYIDLLCVSRVWENCKAGYKLLKSVERYGTESWNWREVSFFRDAFDLDVQKFVDNNKYKLRDSVYIWSYKEFLG
jgi:Acetyltransferase (GNAT) family